MRVEQGPAPAIERVRVQNVPGGGPASRWSPSRFPSVGARIWLGCVLVLPLLAVAALVGGRGEYGATETSIWLSLGSFLLWVVALAATGAGVGAANDSRVDDDVLVHAAGSRVSVRRGGDGTAHAPVLATVEVGGRAMATLREVPVRFERPQRARGRKGGRGGARPSGLRPRRVLEVDGSRYVLRRVGPDPGDVALVDGDAHLALVRTWAGGTSGALRDREIDVDGYLLRMRSRPGRTPPRRTLLDDEGRAWRVEHRRDATHVTLPAEMTETAAAIVALAVWQADDRPGLAADGDRGGTGAATGTDPGADSWIDAGSWTAPSSWTDPSSWFAGGSGDTGGADPGGSDAGGSSTD